LGTALSLIRNYLILMHKCINNSVGNVYHLEQFVSDFFPYSQKQLGFDKPVTIRFESDQHNADVMLGKTAYYDPDALEVVLYIDGRHPKDIMRSLSHELVHHAQNCRGDFTGQDNTGPGYAQSDPHLRKMEREAYTKGNLIFRDFEDLIKTGKINIEIDFSDSGEPKMSLKEWKNAELNRNLMKKWGFLKESKEVTTEDTEELDERMPGVPDSARSSKAGSQLQPRAGHEPLDLAAKRAGSKSVKGGQIDMEILKKEIEAAKKDANNYRMPGPDGRSRGDQGWHMASMRLGDLQNLAKRVQASKLKSIRGTSGDDLRKQFSTNEADELEEEQAIFAPNHYCVHHGGVQHEGQIKMAEAISHNFDKKLNKVTWYDMKLQDGTILEQVAAEDIQVTNATLESMHGSHRVDDKEKIGSRPHNDEEGNRDPSDDEILGLKRESDNKAAFSGVSMAKQKTQHMKTAQSEKDAKYSELLQAVRDYLAGTGTQATGNLETLFKRIAKEMGGRAKAAPKGASPKGNQISVREAKEITRRIIERIKKESK